MQVNAALNLALPVVFDSTGEPTVWAYHTPISTEVFEANWRIIAKAKQEVFSSGLDYAASNGPKIARLALLDAARADALDRGTEDVGKPFLAELQRLTTILAPGPNGFEFLPVEIALRQSTIDAEDWSEAESQIAFFTFGYAMARRAGRAELTRVLASLMGGSTTPLSLMDYAASLRTSTPAETSETAPSSVPS